MLTDGRIVQSQMKSLSAGVSSDHLLLAIADGVSSSPTPALASSTYLSALAKATFDTSDDLMTGKQVRWAHLRFCDALATKRASHGASTTLVAAHVRGRDIAVLNVGDSRAYLRSKKGGVAQVSRDHTELQRLRDAGSLEAGVAYASLYDALTDCLVADFEEIDFNIHRSVLRLDPGDMLILCSDGVHSVLGDEVWESLACQHEDPDELVSATRRAVLAASAPDNFSIIAARLQGDRPGDGS